MIWLLLVTFCLVASSPLPSVTRKCGNVELTETTFQGVPLDIYPFFYLDNTKIVFLHVTLDSHLYRSVDEGKTWELQSTNRIMPGSTTGIRHVFHGKPNAANTTMYFIGLSGSIWLSQDSGATYKRLTDAPVDIDEILPHPEISDLVIAKSAKALYLVEANGEKWTKLGAASHAHILWGKGQRIFLHNNSDLIYSDDSFKTQHLISVPQSVLAASLMPPNTVVVTACADNSTTCKYKNLWISDDGGDHFGVAKFPDYQRENKRETNFYVWEIEDDSMWIGVENPCTGGICTTDLYHSYDSDKEFTLSLPKTEKYGFTKYSSLNGIYIANQYYVTGGAVKIRSLITFNKGSVWDLIQAPAFDSHKQPTNCQRENGCGLHLHGWDSENLDYFYSVPNAVGIMVASGNIGNNLEEHTTDVGLYFSRTGGLSWEEVRKGRWIMEIGDHGSIIVLADLKNPTSSILYSVTDGDEWITCDLGTQPFMVTNIVVDEGWDSRQFIVFGTRESEGKTDAVLIHVNFDNAYPQGQCKEETDYEAWTPQAEHGHCFMGQKTTYMRRKLGVACYYGPDHQMKTKTEQCPCQKEDFECAPCFFRPDLGRDCQRECGETPPPTKEQCPTPDATYEVDNGYRNPGPITPVPPPSSFKFQTKEVFMMSAAILVFTGAVGGILFIILYNRHEGFRDAIQRRCGLARVEHIGQALADTSDSDLIVEDNTLSSDSSTEMSDGL